MAMRDVANRYASEMDGFIAAKLGEVEAGEGEEEEEEESEEEESEEEEEEEGGGKKGRKKKREWTLNFLSVTFQVPAPLRHVLVLRLRARVCAQPQYTWYQHAAHLHWISPTPVLRDVRNGASLWCYACYLRSTQYQARLCCYALATPCPVLSEAMLLPGTTLLLALEHPVAAVRFVPYLSPIRAVFEPYLRPILAVLTRPVRAVSLCGTELAYGVGHVSY
eukprot:2285497-Rhodomonas_salina.4